MRSFKRGLLVGFVLGYVKGSKAGRERYEQIRRYAEKVKASEPYRRARSQLDAAIGMGFDAGKLKLVDGVQRATSRPRANDFDSEIRSTFH